MGDGPDVWHPASDDRGYVIGLRCARDAMTCQPMPVSTLIISFDFIKFSNIAKMSIGYA